MDEVYIMSRENITVVGKGIESKETCTPHQPDAGLWNTYHLDPYMPKYKCRAVLWVDSAEVCYHSPTSKHQEAKQRLDIVLKGSWYG